MSLDADYYGAFPRRMRELGYVEGRNLVIDWRFAGGEYERLPDLAAELVRLKADVILALGPPGALAAQKATATIPIVIVVSIDPVAAGLVRSLAQPGGNITGLVNLAADLSSKHLEMLVAMVPKLDRVALLLNPANPAHDPILRNVQAAAQKSHVGIVPVKARTPQEIESAFATFAREQSGAVIIALDPLFIQQVPQVAALATRQRLPSIFSNREYAEAGRPARRATHDARAGRQRQTAKALGLTVPQSLAARADAVIE